VGGATGGSLRSHGSRPSSQAVRDRGMPRATRVRDRGTGARYSGRRGPGRQRATWCLGTLSGRRRGPRVEAPKNARGHGPRRRGGREGRGVASARRRTRSRAADHQDGERRLHRRGDSRSAPPRPAWPRVRPQRPGPDRARPASARRPPGSARGPRCLSRVMSNPAFAWSTRPGTPRSRGSCWSALARGSPPVHEEQVDAPSGRQRVADLADRRREDGGLRVCRAALATQPMSPPARPRPCPIVARRVGEQCPRRCRS
jgi:hypothetical protein